jgi:electron transport complex protein RnfG
VRIDETTAGEANLFAVYGGSGELAGIALQGAAQGYQDVVRTLYGYDPDCGCIVGLTIMKSTDTPGMGDKKTVEGDAKFMANFEELSAELTADKSSVAHPIETVKHGSKTEPWEVDAISGATITSRAIGRGLRESTGELLPLIAQHLPEIEVKPEAEVNLETGVNAEMEVIE